MFLAAHNVESSITIVVWASNMFYTKEWALWKLTYSHICKYFICMHRTTILIPEELKGQAEQQARREGLSLSELIRRRLSESIDPEAKSPPSFFSRQPWSGDAPDDLSTGHDDYLYAE